mgnify:FL=1
MLHQNGPSLTLLFFGELSTLYWITECVLEISSSSSELLCLYSYSQICGQYTSYFPYIETHASVLLVLKLTTITDQC